MRGVVAVVFAVIVLGCSPSRDGGLGPPRLGSSHGVSARFTGERANIRWDAADGERERLSIGVSAIGREGAMLATQPAPARRDGDDVVREVSVAGAVEWWRRVEAGLEHGVTIGTRPSGAGSLRVEVSIDGNLSVQAHDDTGVDLVRADGSVAARYAQLAVLDARGQRIPARMIAQRGVVHVEIDDRTAEYPLVVDPLVATEQAVLGSLAGVANGVYGSAVAMSADGSLAFIGEPAGSTSVTAGAGRVQVLRRTATGWSLQTTLYAQDGETGDGFGASIAVSADASLVIVGAPSDLVGASRCGTVRTFRSNAFAGWDELIPNVVAGTDDLGRFGSSVALAPDGSRAVMGAENMDTSSGTTSGQASVLTWDGFSWTVEATLQPTDLALGDHFGVGVALDASASIAAIGASRDNTPGGNDAGSVRIYRRAGTTWTPDAAPVLDPTPAMTDFFGASVALDASGTVLAVGAPQDSAAGSRAGALLMFRYTAGAWIAEATLNGTRADDQLGTAVAISSDGAHVVAGAPSRFAVPSRPGMMRVYDHAASWTLGATLAPAAGSVTDQLGAAVAISSTGSIIVGGASGADTIVGTNVGTAFGFRATAGVWDGGVEIPPAGGIYSAGFGSALALSADGSRAAVMASGQSAVYVMLRTGAVWAHEARLMPASQPGVVVDTANASVAISADGHLIALGTPLTDTPAGTDAGQVRIFARDTFAWTEVASLTAQAAAANDWFGYSVAMTADGTRLVVGAPEDTTTFGASSGSARVFLGTSPSAWSEEATLVTGVAGGAYYLGWSVSISDDGATVLVGSPGENHTFITDNGGARAFVRSGTTWSLQGSLFPAGAPAYADYGWSVALSADGSRALLGGPDQRPGGVSTGPGHASVFTRTAGAWAEEATLALAGGVTNDVFGSAVSLSADGNRALVGAPGTAAGGAGQLYLRASGSWSPQSALVPSARVAGERFGASVAWTRGGGYALVGRPAALAGDVAPGAVHVFVVTGANGDACGETAACTSGNCVDGVCCDTTCGGGAADCQACSVAAGGATDGTCTPLTTPVVCRPTVGACDPAESCSTSALVCPTDVRASAGTVCRPLTAGSGCDAVEVCDGTAGTCPTDAPARMDTICRAAVGACDNEERCDGMSFACPGDALLPMGVSCGGTAGSCTSAGMCDGSSPSCPGTTLYPAGRLCLRRDLTNPCDVDDVCDGMHDNCPVTYAMAGTVCAPTAGDLCDAPDVCAGTSADCIPTYATGVVCRAATGACDVAESCSGTAAACPPDALLAAGVTCRMAAGACDTAEACDGTTASCPPDVSMCSDSGVPDAGTDAAMRADASIPADAATTPPPTAGCACRAEHRASDGSWLLVGLLSALALRRRRRGDWH